MSPRPAGLRSLPSVDRLLRHPAGAELLGRYSRELVMNVIRTVLENAREAMTQDTDAEVPDCDSLIIEVNRRLAVTTAPRLQPVINATGVVLHTGLGRALLAEEAMQAAARAACHPVNLEYDIAGGERGHRDAHVESHLVALTGAEAAAVVNNNAAAVLLSLNTHAEGRDVIVSRGELIEIGGSFRMPDIVEKSGARLHPVGTTNRTHPLDYERAIGPETALLLKVHPSNYRIVGFTAEVSLRELVRIGHPRGLPVMEDLGSGALVDLAQFGLPKEPVAAERIRAGADLVTFSGDKLLGGPQAGLIVGRRDLIERIQRNPLKRALRCDKLTLAALEATLCLYRSAPDLAAALPTLRTLTRSVRELEDIGRAALPLLQKALGTGYELSIVETTSEAGSGALPTESLPSRAIAVRHPDVAPLEIAARFRRARPSIIGRVHDGRFLLDLRCIWHPHEIVPRELGNSPTGSAL